MRMATGSDPSDGFSITDFGPGAEHSGKTKDPPNNDDKEGGQDGDPTDGIKGNPEKFFESLSSKIEDQLRMLEWEMSSNFQEVAISDFLGNGNLNDDAFSASFDDSCSINDVYEGQRRRSSQQDGCRKRSRDLLTSSVSSMSSILDEDDKTSDVGADGDVENNTSESSRSGSFCSNSDCQPVAASIVLVENDAQTRTVDYFAEELVKTIMRDISTIFTKEEDAILWASAYEPGILPRMSRSYNQCGKPPQSTDTAPETYRAVLFSKTFSGDQVTFADDRWFPHDSHFDRRYIKGISYRSVDEAYDKRRPYRRQVVGSDRAHEPERRIFHRARFQMHDIQNDLRRLKARLHDVRDDRDASSDIPSD